MLIDEPEVLWKLYEGWAIYRKFIEERPNLKGNQIDTWNGKWITHALRPDFDPKRPLDFFSLNPTEKDGIQSILTEDWVQVIYALARKYGKAGKSVMAYVYNLAQTNKTIGFVPVLLPEVAEIYDLTDRFFEYTPAVPNQEALLSLYKTHFGFARACTLGSIGLHAIAPAKLRDYLPSKEAKAYSLKTEEAKINLQLYKIWIIAMLNNEALYELANRTAQALHDFQRGAERMKSNRSREVESLLKEGRLKSFIEQLNNIMVEDCSNKEIFQQVVQNSIKMPVGDFPLFVTLVRFQLTFLSC